MNTVLGAPGPAALPRLYDAGDLATLFGVVRYTILQWQKNGTLPPGRRFGRVLRWTADDIRPLLAARVRDGVRADEVEGPIGVSITPART
jgi:hypothetical protein